MTEALPTETMQIAGGRTAVALRGPSAQLLHLQQGQRLKYAWEPINRAQHEVEIRMRMLGTTAVLGQIPIVRWRAEVGHGKAVWSEPAPSSMPISGELAQLYSLPARGTILRLNVRELTLTVFFQGPVAGPAIGSVDVQLSIMPCLGMQLPTLPLQHLANPVGGGILQPFPMEAREWKATDAVGAPLILGAVTAVYAGIAGALIGPVDLSTVADWRPIPHDAIGWKPSAPHYAVFR